MQGKEPWKGQVSDGVLIPPLPVQVPSADSGIERLRTSIEVLHPGHPFPGELVGNYRLLNRIGSGGMGSVYEAVHTETGEPAAVKVLSPEFSRHPDALRRFRKECRLLAEVASPHVTRLFDIIDDADWQALVMQLVDGESLRQVLSREGAFSEAAAADVAAQVAQALADLSHLSILHRDIKPENILLKRSEKTPSGFHVMLTDFGLARHAVQSESLAMTAAHAVLGTPKYMSPEQFSDRDVDPRSDVYSLGITLFEMLTGRTPFVTNDLLEIAEMHRHSVPPRPETIRPSLSDGICEITWRCLQKRPDMRYASAGELLNDLRRFQSGEPISRIEHPLLPSRLESRQQTFRYEWRLKSSVGELWPYVSNTERLNRALGLPPVEYTTTRAGSGDTITMAEVVIAGIRMRWREYRFEWIRNQQLGVLREFQSGPLKWFTSVVELVKAADGSTTLVHSFRVAANGRFGQLFAKLKFGLEVRRSLTRVYQRIDGVLSSSESGVHQSDPFEDANAMSRQELAALQLVTERLLNRPELNRQAVISVTEFVRTAPSQDLASIRPLQLASRLNLPAELLLAVGICGISEGLFELVWNVICPSCRLASQHYDTMKLLKEHDYCEACDFEFRTDFSSNVELTLRAHPRVRKADLRKYCIGSPGHSPHVVAQMRVAPTESLRLGLALKTGTYLLRSPQLSQRLSFRVEPEADGAGSRDSGAQQSQFNSQNATEIAVPFSHMRHQSLDIRICVPEDWNHDLLRFRPGNQLVTITNDSETEVLIRIEDTSHSEEVLSLAAAVSMPLFRELLPTESPTPQQLASFTHAVLVQTRVSTRSGIEAPREQWMLMQEHLNLLHGLCRECAGNWVKIKGQGALMSFFSEADANRFVNRLAETHPFVAPVVDESIETNGITEDSWNVTAAVVSGPVQVIVIDGRIDYLGPLLEELELSVEEQGQAGQIRK